MIELASAASDVVAPVAFILRAVRPNLDAETMPDVKALLELAFVDGSVGKDDLFPKFEAFLLQ